MFGFRLWDIARAIAGSVIEEALRHATGQRRAEEAIREARVARAMAEEALRVAREEREPRRAAFTGRTVTVGRAIVPAPDENGWVDK